MGSKRNRIPGSVHLKKSPRSLDTFTKTMVEIDEATRSLEYDPTGGRGFANPMGWGKDESECKETFRNAV